jgi:hypothetical protein
MQLPPLVLRPSEYTDEQRAVAGGYLLGMRSGTLQALASSEKGVLIATDIGLQNQIKYYSNCEEYSRFLLYWIGYQVYRKKMYGET